MRYYFIAALVTVMLGLCAKAQERRALLIAIDNYTPPASYKPVPGARTAFRNLNGCINDARAMQSIIVSRFQFAAANVDTLFNEAASREAILNQLNGLLGKCKSGDVAVIYYAGHGSQVTNSLSKEADKKDESMVPADTWKPGVEDIRDKELAKIYNRFLDKGIRLTVIMDCCHSGSLARGPQEAGAYRYIESAFYDAKDASQPVAPETRKEGNFLVLSAAQDNEFAQEQKDEHHIPHGAFTIALIQALEQQSVNASAINLYTAIRAILKSNGKKQEPVLGGSAERQQQTLFGIEKGTVPDKSLIAVSGFEDDRVFLQGGFALGLYKENELVKLRGTDTLVKLRIDSVLGVNKSIATVIEGSKYELKAGELLEVTNWVSSQAPLLKLYIPSGNISYEQVLKLAGVNKELQQSKKVRWINDLEKTDPYTSLYYNGSAFMINTDGKQAAMPSAITANAVLQLCKADSTFYFELPPAKELTDAMVARLGQQKSIVLVNDPADAQYILYGTIDASGQPAYGLRRAQTSARDSLESMPVQTKAFTLRRNDPAAYTELVNDLYGYAMRLSKIRGWLQLVPPKDGNNQFPFHLELSNTETQEPIINHHYRVGDKVSFHLVADSNATIANRVKRYIYVFLIDREGNMTLAYPDAADGNVANQFPKFDNTRTLVGKIFLFEGEVGEPVGTDNYFLLASDEPITNYSTVFMQAGVRAADRDTNPLGNLLNLGNEEGTRGFTKSVANWNLIRLPVKSSQ